MSKLNTFKTIFVLLGAVAWLTAPACMVDHEPGVSGDQVDQTSAEILGDLPLPVGGLLDKVFNLLTKLPLPNGNELAFYQPEPGTLLISETGSADELPLVDRLPNVLSMTPTEIYEALAQQPAPPVLAAAEQLVESLPVRSPGLPGDQGPAPQALDAPQTASPGGMTSWFQDHLCSLTSEHDWGACQLEQSGAAAEACDDVSELYAAAYAVHGDVSLALWNEDDEYQGAWPVPQGTYRWFMVWGEDLEVGADVLGGAGDDFHFTAGCLE